MDEKYKKKKIWPVWSLRTSGKIVLHSVCTEKDLAETHLDYLQNTTGLCEGTIRAWIEKADTNHLYAELFYITHDTVLGMYSG